MDTLKKFFAPLLLVALFAGGVGIATHRAELPKAEAQDTWTGHAEEVIPSTITVTGATAAIITAVSSRKLVVKSLVLHAAAAGIFSFHDGASGANLGSFYLETNKPFVIPESNLGVGMKTTSGNALHASGTANTTLTITARVQKQ